MATEWHDILAYPFANFKRMFNWLYLIIPVIGIFVFYGYLRNVFLSVARGNNEELPVSGDFIDNLSKGFMLCLGFAVYSIPLLVMVFILGFIAGFAQDSGKLITLLLIFIFYVLVFLYAVVLLIISVPFFARYCISGRWKESLDVKANLRVANLHVNDFIRTLLIIIGVNAAYTIPGLIPYLGYIWTVLIAPAATYSTVYLIAQWYKSAAAVQAGQAYQQQSYGGRPPQNQPAQVQTQYSGRPPQQPLSGGSISQ